MVLLTIDELVVAGRVDGAGAIPPGAFIASTARSLTFPHGVACVRGAEHSYGQLAGAFSFSMLVRVTFPASMTSLGAGAFAGCTSLQAVLAPGIVTIGDCVFDGCTSLRTASFPPSLRTVGNRAFMGCAQIAVAIGAGLEGVGNSAFEGCTTLVLVSFPRVRTLGDSAFAECAALRAAEFPALDAMGRACFEGCLSLRTASFGGHITQISVRTFVNCSALEQFCVPAGVGTIRVRAFSGCGALSLVECAPGAKLTHIGGWAFNGCTSLVHAGFPPTVRYIGEAAFNGCAFTALRLPALDRMGPRAFTNCHRLRTVRYTAAPEFGVPAGAFMGCNQLATVELPGPVGRICAHAFAQTRLREIPAGCTALEAHALAGVALSEVHLSPALRRIDRTAFMPSGGALTLVVGSSSDTHAECAAALVDGWDVTRVFAADSVVAKLGGAFAGHERGGYAGLPASLKAAPPRVRSYAGYILWREWDAPDRQFGRLPAEVRERVVIFLRCCTRMPERLPMELLLKVLGFAPRGAPSILMPPV